MIPYCADYVWKNGRPKPTQHLPEASLPPLAYRIVSDPYGKRTMVEKYRDGHFDAVVYDSALFPFKSLKGMEHEPWQRTPLSQTPTKTTSLLRDPEDRPILTETVHFNGDLPYRCDLHSIHGIPLAHHETIREETKAIVILYDTHSHPIFWKEYSLDPDTGAFATLLQEQWDMSSHSPPKDVPVPVCVPVPDPDCIDKIRSSRLQC